MKHLSAIVFSLAIIIAALFLGNAYVKRARPQQIISTTGLGSENFTSDLIVWEGQFSAFSPVLTSAYDELNRQKKIVQDYLNFKRN